ncbi:C4-type zinc ribbon domain-containing protein [Corynebacterium sp. Q4381]|uniref:zinc ribbon domain-containing protein n=1 Tax=Corynebacterium sp. Marseille-Q4381 TaxID=3121597 RepID=UPI002FE5D16A
MHLSPNLQPVLLELANADRARRRPVHRPEEQELSKLIDARDRLQLASSSAQLAVDDMELEIRRIQEDSRKLERRKKDDVAQLGAETDNERRKDLQHDLSATEARLTDLRYELKEAHNEIAALRNNRDVHGAQLDEATRKVEAAQRTVDALPEPEVVDTEELRTQLPADVLDVYDRVGAASFNGRTCNSCYIQLPPSERAEVMAAEDDELPTCPNCGTLLVRVSPDASSPEA